MKPFIYSLLLVCSIAKLSATTILIDFGTALTTGGSSTWNNFTVATGTVIPNGTAVTLLDTDGANTGFLITLSGGDLNSLTDNTTSPIANTYAPFTPATVIQDSVFQTGKRVFTLSNLNSAITYNITFFSYVDRNTTRATSFAIPGYTTLNLEPSGSPLALDSGGQVGTISSVLPNGSNEIAITAASTASTNWILNGIQITYTIPEPSALFLSSFGLLPLLRRRRIS